MKLLVSLAILALAAAQTPAIHTEEVVPEFEFVADDDGSVADDFLVQSYNQAKEALAKNGEGACKKLADDTENAVKSNVDAEQKIINAMDNGSDCHKSGDHLITAAENKLKQAKTDEQKAKVAKENAEGQKISLGSLSFKQLESIHSNGKCNKDIIMGSDYKGAVATVKAKRNAHTSAKGAITAAKGDVEDAKKEAKKLVNKCMCNLIKEHDAAVKATNKKNQDANKKAWTQAAHIRCVVDSVPMAKCKVGKPPVVVPAKLAAGVKCTKQPSSSSSSSKAFQAKVDSRCKKEHVDLDACIGTVKSTNTRTVVPFAKAGKDSTCNCQYKKCGTSKWTKFSGNGIGRVAKGSDKCRCPPWTKGNHNYVWKIIIDGKHTYTSSEANALAVGENVYNCRH